MQIDPKTIEAKTEEVRKLAAKAEEDAFTAWFDKPECQLLRDILIPDDARAQGMLRTLLRAAFSNGFDAGRFTVLRDMVNTMHTAVLVEIRAEDAAGDDTTTGARH